MPSLNPSALKSFQQINGLFHIPSLLGRIKLWFPLAVNVHYTTRSDPRDFMEVPLAMMVRLATRKAHELREAVPPRITYMLLFGTVHYFGYFKLL